MNHFTEAEAKLNRAYKTLRADHQAEVASLNLEVSEGIADSMTFIQLEEWENVRIDILEPLRAEWQAMMGVSC